MIIYSNLFLGGFTSDYMRDIVLVDSYVQLCTMLGFGWFYAKFRAGSCFRRLLRPTKYGTSFWVFLHPIMYANLG